MLLRQLNQLSFGFQTFSMTVVADFLVENRFHAIVRLFTLFWFFLNFEVFYSLSFTTPYSLSPFSIRMWILLTASLVSGHRNWDELTPSSESTAHKLYVYWKIIVLITTTYTFNHCYVITLHALCWHRTAFRNRVATLS